MNLIISILPNINQSNDIFSKSSSLAFKLNEVVAKKSNGFHFNTFYSNGNSYILFTEVIDANAFQADLGKQLNVLNMNQYSVKVCKTEIAKYNPPEIHKVIITIKLDKATRKNIGYIQSLGLYGSKKNCKSVTVTYNDEAKTGFVTANYVSKVTSIFDLIGNLDAISIFELTFDFYDESGKILYKGEIKKMFTKYNGYFCDDMGIRYCEFEEFNHISQITEKIAEIFYP